MPDAEYYTFQHRCRLCQQTPLLHHQHRDPTATLRGAQVKPMLERYLLARYGTEALPPSWCHRPGHLDFQLRLTAAEPPVVQPVGRGTPYDLFYANVYAANDRQALVGDCLLTVTCFEPTLMAFIKEHLPGFFVVTNFGACKSKGFGSYLPQGTELTDGQVARLLRQATGATAVACFTSPDREQLFRQIRTVYSLMKGGMHVAPRRRSLLYVYMDTVCGFDHERTMLKANGVVDRPTARYHDKGRYVRGLLGVPEFYGFGTGRDTQRVTVRHRATEGIPLRQLESPLLVKVIGDRVFLAARPINEALYGACFTFTLETKNAPPRHTELTVPTREELGEDFLARFLRYCVGRMSGEDNLLDLYPVTRGIRLREVVEE